MYFCKPRYYSMVLLPGLPCFCFGFNVRYGTRKTGIWKPVGTLNTWHRQKVDIGRATNVCTINLQAVECSMMKSTTSLYTTSLSSAFMSASCSPLSTWSHSCDQCSRPFLFSPLFYLHDCIKYWTQTVEQKKQRRLGYYFTVPLCFFCVHTTNSGWRSQLCPSATVHQQFHQQFHQL